MESLIPKTAIDDALETAREFRDTVLKDRQAAMSKVAECNAILRRLDRKIEQFETMRDSEPVPKATPVVGRSAQIQGLPTIRGTLRDALHSRFQLEAFSRAELIAEVLRRLPHAKEDSVSAEFSIAKSRGEIHPSSDGRFLAGHRNVGLNGSCRRPETVSG